MIVERIAAMTTTSNIARDLADAGTIIAKNMPYKASPIAFCKTGGKIFVSVSPTSVPLVHPIIGTKINPAIKEKDNVPCSKDAKLNVSSVIPKEITILSSVDIFWSIFWLKDKDIKKYLALIINNVNAVSIYEAWASIKDTPANCPDDVKLVNEINVAKPNGKPLEATKTPKEKETGKLVLEGETKHCFTDQKLKPVNLKKYKKEFSDKFENLLEKK